MTIQLAKDQATNESENGATVESLFLSIQAGFDPISALDDFINRSMQIYAEAKEKEFAIWISKAASSTMENGIWLDLKCNEMTTDELYEVYKTQS